MKRLFLAAVFAAALVAGGRAAQAENLGAAALEAKVAADVRSPEVTVVHFWAPWCPNCKAELGADGWPRFIASNPRIHFDFVTIWSAQDGRELLDKCGVGTQPNFRFYAHPNTSRARGAKVSTLLGLPISWIPSTWVFKDGRLRYALNFGELHFSLLQQLVADSENRWEH